MPVTTINDVAKLAGVSITTVSRVINNEPSVRKKTREKVLEAVKSLDFQPNVSARNLSGSKSYILGYIYDNPNTYYVIGMQNGILDACRAQGYGLLIHPCSVNSNNIIEDLQKLIRQSRISGLILTPPFSEKVEITRALTDMDVEYVCIVSGNGPADNIENKVIIEDRKAAYKITKHLIDYGHKDIAFLSGDEGHASTSERLLGYKSALKDHNIALNADLVIAGEYSYESGNRRALELLSGSQNVTAVFGCNDEIAAGAQHAARLLNIPMPEKLSIAGFEDSPFSRQALPRLTTARQSNRTISNFAAKMLINRIRPQKTPPKKTRDNRENRNEVSCFDNNTFTPEFVQRESTAPAPE